MDSIDYDDDIADEDLVEALTQSVPGYFFHIRHSCLRSYSGQKWWCGNACRI